MKSAPCLNCPDRVMLCHSTCRKYLEYAEERKQISAARAKYNEENCRLVFDQKRKLRSKHGR